jgi:hypothetical protein
LCFGTSIGTSLKNFLMRATFSIVVRFLSALVICLIFNIVFFLRSLHFLARGALIHFAFEFTFFYLTRFKITSTNFCTVFLDYIDICCVLAACSFQKTSLLESRRMGTNVRGWILTGDSTQVLECNDIVVHSTMTKRRLFYCCAVSEYI